MTAAAADLIVAKAQTGGRFEDGEVTPDLSRLAGQYIREYAGDFAFLVSVKADALERGGWKSRAQVRGVLNCMVADARKALKDRASQAVQPASGSVSSPGAAQPIDQAGSLQTSIEDGLYTVVLAGKTHRTLRVRHGHDAKSKDTQFVSFLSGTDNERDYTCCGFVKSGEFRFSSRFKDCETELRTAVYGLLAADTTQQQQYGRNYALQSGNCYICNRTLTDPVSITTGVGPICRKKHGIEAVQPEPVEAEREQSVPAAGSNWIEPTTSFVLADSVADIAVEAGFNAVAGLSGVATGPAKRVRKSSKHTQVFSSSDPAMRAATTYEEWKAALTNVS